MMKNLGSEAAKTKWRDDVYRIDQWLKPGAVEIERLGDIVSCPKTVVAQEPLDKVLYLHLLDGAARVTLSDVGEKVLHAGEVLVVFPGRVVSVELVAEANRLMLVTLQGREAVNASLQLGFWDLMQSAERYGGDYMGEIINRFSAASLRGRDPQVLRMVEQLLETTWLRMRNGSAQGELFDVIRTINRLSAVGLTTESAAAAFGISRTKLNMLFLSGLGMRPGEYIAKIILARSLAMLFWTRLSVAQIAVKMGFSSASAFAVFMRGRTGQTPMLFRRTPIPTSRSTKSF